VSTDRKSDVRLTNHIHRSLQRGLSLLASRLFVAALAVIQDQPAGRNSSGGDPSLSPRHRRVEQQANTVTFRGE